MDPVVGGLVLSLLVAAWTVPLGVARVIAYRTNDIDHNQTMRISATLALAIGGVALASFVVLLVVLAVR